MFAAVHPVRELLAMFVVRRLRLILIVKRDGESFQFVYYQPEVQLKAVEVERKVTYNVLLTTVLVPVLATVLLKKVVRVSALLWEQGVVLPAV